ncbi:MAG: ATP-binding protein [Chloroflexota bacterium]|nr:ATP-binding protein [Chloroflexota bacterium]
MARKRLGVVTDGAFNAGLTVRLDPGLSTEEMRIGDFVVVEGEDNRYFSMIADMQLRATDAGVLADPPRGISPFIAQALRGTTTYATVQVKPMLMMARGAETDFVVDLEPPQPVRTIPMHFAELHEATENDFGVVFGHEDKTHFAMGTPLTMDIPICVDLERLVERSNGVFGQSGTGKSFLVRLLLCGVIKSGVAVNLVFDMHDEYAFGKESEDGKFVKGLKHLFGSKVLIYSLDERAAARAGRNVDVTLQIGLNQIEAEDVLLLAEELNLRSTAEANVGLLTDAYGDDWLSRFLAMGPADISEFCERYSAHAGSLEALQRNLKRIERRPYVVADAPFSVIDEMVAVLDKGQHVILHFGRYDQPLDHMLVANVVTRRVRHLYREKAERYEQTQSPADKPRPLMITIEEAHKFLNPAVSRQTIFGIIARELRKYHVTLTVVDQRPSGIDNEVLSQLGTRITGKLTEERDIEGVLTGVAGRSFLRGALESLDTREQILLMGHAVPMPIVVQTRKYDEVFYAAMGAGEKRSSHADIAELFGE